MGIPSYFSYIIKNYTNIIRKQSGCERIQHLLMDCNSIVYDAFRELEDKYKNEPFDIATIETRLIEKTITKIVEYIQLICPEKTAFITFDGVAPFAKMDQQRIRRYKTQSSINPENKPIWNTTAITPGTTFMTNLSKKIKQYFRTNRLPNINIFTSCSDEIGEGEHKLFHFIRTNDCTNDTIAVYGLDADLIMLSIFHQQFCSNIYVFREAPNFKTVLSSEFEQKELLFMDIFGLSNSIFQEMGNYDPTDKQIRVTDYIFMCFLLGNDFLPHFPALNIRVNGIQKLMDTYYQTIGKFRDRSLIHRITKKINWKYLGIFLTDLGNNEHHFLLKEYEIRSRWDTKTWPSNTPEEKENLLLNVPIIYRADEKYISPQQDGWQERYYNRLLDISEPSDNKIKNACINYLEGLEWVYTYYTSDCPDWKWKYNYSYPPLLKDLAIYIPNLSHKSFLTTKKPDPFEPLQQLAYVLPRSQLSLLPQEYQEKILREYQHLYPTEYIFKWAFCRYFWEAHPILPEIHDIKEIVRQ